MSEVLQKVVRITQPEEMEIALAIRQEVFQVEQSVSYEREVDEFDSHLEHPNAIYAHVLVMEGSNGVATGRIYLPFSHQEWPMVGRVAVIRSRRGHGLGRLVMEALEKLARDGGYQGVELSAQTHAIGFYEELGYMGFGDLFFDAGIEHRKMRMRFSASD